MTELVVVGSSAAVPNSSNPTSCLVLRDGGREVMLDCGHGAVAAARVLTDLDRLSALYVSHVHPDHIGDLFALRGYFYLRPSTSKTALLATKVVHEALDAIVEAMGLGTDYLRGQFEFQTLAQRGTRAVGNLMYETWPADHNSPSTILRITTSGGKSLVYTSDTGPTEELVDLASEADLLVVENAAPLGDSSARGRWHMDAADIAHLVASARPHRTLITHYFDEFVDQTIEYVRSRIPAATVDKAIQGATYAID